MGGHFYARKVLVTVLVAALAVAATADASARRTSLRYKSVVRLEVTLKHVERSGRVHVFVNKYADYRKGVAQKMIEVPVVTIKVASGGAHVLSIPVTAAVKRASQHGARKSAAPGRADFYFIGDFGQRSCVSQKAVLVLKSKSDKPTAGVTVKFGSCQTAS